MGADGVLLDVDFAGVEFFEGEDLRFVEASRPDVELALRRKEKPPLMYCMAFSKETSGAGVRRACRWSGMTMKAWSWKRP